MYSSEKLFLTQGAALVKLGLRDLGYVHVNIDVSKNHKTCCHYESICIKIVQLDKVVL